MIELVGYRGVTFYVIQISRNLVMSFVPMSVEVPSSVVSSVHLRSFGHHGVSSLEHMGNASGFLVETWLIR